MALTTRDRNYTLFAILLALFLGAIDQTIVATALPKIVDDLGGLSRYSWVITAYLVASTALVPIYGKLADMFSRKTVELVSIGLFLTGSALCGLAGEFGPLPLLGDGMTQLIIFRAIQGLGGAGLFSLAFIIIADLYPPKTRGKYQGYVGAVFGIASILGPLLGGLLTDHAGGWLPGVAGWRWVFYVNVPFGALAVWFIVTRMPALKPAAGRGRLDYLAAAFLTLGIAPLIIALQLDRDEFPWGSPEVIGMLVASAVLLGGFVLKSLRSSNPILDLKLFRNPVFAVSNLALFFQGAAFLCTVVFLPLFTINVIGVSATVAGLSLVPLSLGVTLGSVVAGQLVSHIGRYRMLILAGSVLVLIGVGLLMTMTPETTLLQVMIYVAITGVGVGPSMPLYTLAIQNAVDVRRLGQATSASQFFRQIGGAVGAAVLGTVMTVTLATSFAGNLGDASGLAGAGPASPAEVEAAVLTRSSAQLDALEAALQAGDVDGAAGALTALQVAPQDQAGILNGYAEAASSGAEAAFMTTTRADLEGAAAAQAARVVKVTKGAFTDAITKLFAYVLGIVVIATLVTVFLPVLPLRDTFDSQAAPAGA